MNEDDLASITEASSLEEFLRPLEAFSHRWGFGTCDATAFIQSADAPPRTVVVDNLPQSDDWLALAPLGLGRRCPVMQHCKYHSTPAVWDYRTYADRQLSDIYDAFSGFGLRSGISMSVHLPRRRFLQLSLHTDKEIPRSNFDRLLPDFRMLAAYAMVPAATLFDLADPEGELSQELTPIETDALRRLANGQDPAQISKALHLSESAVESILSIATSTLGCPNFISAAFRAKGLGII